MNTKKNIRAVFREVVFNRDKWTCKTCHRQWQPSANWQLDAHHITNRNDLINGGYVPENGIFLCPECHWKAEAYHRNEDPEDGFWPDQLYELIGSSYEKAVAASERLG